MRAAEIPRFGAPDVFRIVEKPDPVAGAGHSVISVRAAGINFADLMMRMGLYPEAPPCPFVPGYEVAGTLADGRRVMAFTHFGGCATRVAAPDRAILPLPDSLTFEEGAAIPVNYATAWVALVAMANVREGESVLIEQAAGGVGIAAIQIASHAKATIYGVVGSDAKAEAIRAMGVTPLVRGRDPWPDGLDVILDPTGPRGLERSLPHLGGAGRVVLFGASDYVTGPTRNLLATGWRHWRRPRIDPMALMHRNIGIFGLNMLTLADKPEVIARAADEIGRGITGGWLKPRIDRAFPLDKIADAHAHIHARRNIGKVVLTMPA